MMKQIILLFTILFTAGLTSCLEDNYYDSLPEKIQSFVSEYYPNSKIINVQSSSKQYKLMIKNGPSMVFDGAFRWTLIDGNGSTLPEVLLYNELPTAMYDYLEETQQLDCVFLLQRNDKTYDAKLLKDVIHYDIATGKITGQIISPV